MGAENSQWQTAQANHLRWAGGNEAAARFLDDLGIVIHVPDDLVDRDLPAHEHRPARCRDAARFLDAVLIRVAGNPFYQQNLPALAGAMISDITSWHVSTCWESEDGTRKLFSFVLRSAFNTTVLVAYLCGGLEHSLRVAEEVAALQADAETYEEWINGLV